MNKIPDHALVITVYGGVVCSVVTKDPALKDVPVVVIDYDVTELDAPNRVDITNTFAIGSEPAYAYNMEVENCEIEIA